LEQKHHGQDPVKYNFAHGGNDGVPYPIARKTYDKSGAEIEREQRIGALRRLAEYSVGCSMKINRL
jgi:uncharacterized protein